MGPSALEAATAAFIYFSRCFGAASDLEPDAALAVSLRRGRRTPSRRVKSAQLSPTQGMGGGAAVLTGVKYSPVASPSDD